MVGASAVVALLWRADFNSVLFALKEVQIYVLIIGCFLQIITLLLISLQWQAIACQVGEKAPLAKFLHINLAGAFVDSITPAVKAGGEVTKALLLRSQLDFPLTKAVAIVGLQKVISLIPFLLLSLVSVGWFFTRVGGESLYGKAIICSLLFLFTFVFLLIFLLAYPRRVNSFLSYLPVNIKKKEKIEKAFLSINESIKEAFNSKKKLAWIILLAFIIWGLFAFKAYFISTSININISFPAIAAVTYLSYMIAMLPISPGGLGTFEGSVVFFLAPLNVPLYQGMALAIALRFVTFWFVFLISALYLGINSLHTKKGH